MTEAKNNRYNKLTRKTFACLLDEPLSQKLIKQFHYELKSGVFEDRANGYAIGDYKKRPNMVGLYQAVRPDMVEREMALLLEWYGKQKSVDQLCALLEKEQKLYAEKCNYFIMY